MSKIPQRFSKIHRPDPLLLRYEVKPLEGNEDIWIVEGINYTAGCTYLTLFEGVDASSRAREYANFKNDQLGLVGR